MTIITMKKKIYTIPTIKVKKIEMEQPLAAGSTSGSQDVVNDDEEELGGAKSYMPTFTERVGSKVLFNEEDE